MTEKKVQQILWLNPITFNNLNNMYIKSGAYRVMALNKFISLILDYVSQNEQILEWFLKNLYSVQPKLIEFSYYHTKKIGFCPICDKEFELKSLFIMHLRNEHNINLTQK
jgi:hypothetical protein